MLYTITRVLGPAFETRLLIGGHLPRHPWGGMVLTWRSSRKSRVILSPEAATRKVCLMRANYSIEEPLAAHRVQDLEEQGAQEMLRRDRGAADFRVDRIERGDKSWSTSSTSIRIVRNG
jgi:hypothetical protein